MNDMNDQEKSVVLARLCGWRIECIGFGMNLIIPAGETSLLGGIGDLYDPANMALAWRVLNWAYFQHDIIEDSKYGRLPFGHVIASHFCDTCGARMIPPAEAQRLWLDKILELATEAGLVE